MYTQDVTTVDLSGRERAIAKQEIRKNFVNFYRDTFFRFAGMYDGSVTIDGRDLRYQDMIPEPLVTEMRFQG